MSLPKLFKSSLRFFKKDVISFLIIRRHDLGIEDKLRYLAVRPNASVSVLRQKIWHLLDLPDFCDELIILKRDAEEVPLTELNEGNNPQHPFILEVWRPGYKESLATVSKNMLTMGNDDTSNFREEEHVSKYTPYENAQTVTSEDTMQVNTLHDKRAMGNFVKSDYKKSDLSCRISNSSLMFKLQCRKSRDNFTNILLKIQSDLCTLNNKLSYLENRISS